MRGRRERRLLGPLALLAASVLTTVLVLELAVRLLHVPVGTVQINRATVRRSDNPRLQFELRPGGAVSAEVDYQISSLGLRGPETTVPPQGRRRIAAVGDSITFGYWVREPDAWPRTLEGLLGGAHEVEVLNFGVPGYNLEQELEQVRTRVLEFGPQVVVIGFCLNDLEGLFGYEYGLTLDRAERRSSWLGRTKDALLEHSRLLSFVEYRLTELEARRQFARAKNPLAGQLYEQAVADQHKLLVARFTELALALRPQGVRGVVAIFPALGNRFLNYPHRDLHAAVASAARAAGLEAIDLLDCFSPYDFRELRVDVIHPSPLGHQVAAHAIRDGLCGPTFPCAPVASTCRSYQAKDFARVRGY